jgi:tyrosyl-tRNA synthetase
MNFVEELQWRGLVQDMIPGTDEMLANEKTAGYIGFDPTSDSLHIGSLLPIMILVHFQRAGHTPIALVGGATGMVGDPSGKSKERNLLTADQIQANIDGIKKQLSQFLDFDSNDNAAKILNNMDWFGNMSTIDFLRDIGKHLTVNYMSAKDSVKSRIETGISFTEFSYQLLQGYDFAYLNENHGCKIQMGGSDQWGNITSGVELSRRIYGKESFALTCPLVTKADGGKFGKTESGNVWLDPEKTSPYQFYQFWMNCSDDDAERYIKIFTLMSKEEIENIVLSHKEEPHRRILQGALAKDITCRVHSEEAYETAVKASQILFGKGSTEVLKSLSETDFLSVFDGVPQHTVSKDDFNGGVAIQDLLAEMTTILPSKTEVKRAIKEGSLSINQEKIQDAELTIGKDVLLNDKYILAQRGKKNKFLVILE